MSELKNIKGYENLCGVLGDELGQALYDAVDSLDNRQSPDLIAENERLRVKLEKTNNLIRAKIVGIHNLEDSVESLESELEDAEAELEALKSDPWNKIKPDLIVNVDTDKYKYEVRPFDQWQPYLPEGEKHAGSEHLSLYLIRRKVEPVVEQPYIYDERGGCVAVYKAPKRNCLSGISESADCVFYAHGTSRDDYGWTVRDEDIKTAKRIHAELLKLASERAGGQE